MLQPNGMLAVWAYGINQVSGDAVNELVQDYYSNVVGPYWPPERTLVEEGYRFVRLDQMPEYRQYETPAPHGVADAEPAPQHVAALAPEDIK